MIPQGVTKSQQHLQTYDDADRAQTISNNSCLYEYANTRGPASDDGCGRLSKPEMIWEEDSHSAPSRTSSTSGYRENCSLLMMPMGSSDENSSPAHQCLTNSSSTIMPIENSGSPLITASSDRDMDDDVGSQQTIVTYEHEHEDTLL